MDTKVKTKEGLIKELQKLHGEYDLLKTAYTKDTISRKQTEQILKECENNLEARNKELNGIYSLGNLTEEFNKLEDIYHAFVNNVVPESMQVPEKVFVSLEIDRKKYSNIENFKLSESQINLSAPIKINGKHIGELIVAYTEDLPFIDSFEQNLINSYAERISKITERITTQQTLEKSEIIYRGLVDNSGEGIGIVNVNEEFQFANSTAERIFGVGKGELLGKNLKEFFSKEQYMDIISQTKIRKEGQSSVYEIELTLHNSEKRNVLITAVPQFDDNEMLIGTYGIFRDITERKKSEESLKNINERFNLAVTAASISVWEHDFITDIIQIDDNFKKIYCSTQDNYQIEFNEFIKFIHPDDVDIIKINIEEGIKLDKTMIYEFRIIRLDGNIRNISAYGKIVKDKTNRPIKYIGVNMDISESKKAELELKESETKLHQLNTDKDRFISILGHDLKNPFSNLLGLSDVLTEDIHRLNLDEIKEIAGNINKSVKNTIKLLEDILLWARTQQGKIPFNPQNVSFTDICKNILETLNLNANAKNITINYLARDHQIVSADFDMLKTVLRNLVSNAIKFTNSGGKININAEQNSENVIISVSDNGVGIPSENQTKLFNITEVLTTKGTAGEIGTGLGLLLCKEFVEKHGGNVWVESEYGKGSTFKFTLPKKNKGS